MSQNRITMTIKPHDNKKNPQMDGMIALKKIQHYTYALTDQIGLGFSSHVYRGKNQHNNEPVAVKVIDLKKQDELSRQFMNDQINILEAIKGRNPVNLLKLFDVFKTKNNLYIITEFCEGKDVAKLLRKKKKFTQIEAQSILRQLMNAYRELYELSIVHRDLKLANVFVRKGVIKLADFGFAINSQKCMQKFDYNVGSPYYMPPQALRFNRYSFKSDVWSFGVIAYEMVYGHLPWKEKIESVLFEKITTTPVEDLFEPDVQLTDSYKNFIVNCLQIDYQKRATPEFLMNYQWPLAQDFVQGVQPDPNSNFRPLSMVKVASSGGGQPVGMSKTFTSKNFEEERMRMGNFGPPLALRDRSPAHKTENKIILPHQQDKHKAIIREMMPKPASTKMLDIFQSEESSTPRTNDPRPSQIPRPPTSTTPSLSPVQIANNAQQSILSQIYYCRFMSNLCDLLQENGNVPEVTQLKAQLTSKILGKIQILMKLKDGDNILQVDGFHYYRNTDKWNRLKQIIQLSSQKYKQKYPIEFKNQSFENILFNSIRQLKGNMHKCFGLLEELTYFYQLKDLEKRQSLWQFAVNSKIELLSGRRPTLRGEQNPMLFQRLHNRLALLGF